jgi:hypothetical protein
MVVHPKPQHPVVLDERLAIKVKKRKTITQVLEHFFTTLMSIRPVCLSVCPHCVIASSRQ